MGRLRNAEFGVRSAESEKIECQRGDYGKNERMRRRGVLTVLDLRDVAKISPVHKLHLRIWSSELILELTITERNKQKDRAASAPVFYEE